MITKVMMPKLSDAMETGKVIQWLKKEGEPVKGGDVIAEIETDKANVELEAFGSGVLRKILVQPGGQVPVGELIGIIADPSDDVSGLATAPVAANLGVSSAPAPSAPLVAVPDHETYRSVPATRTVVPATRAVAVAAAPVPVAGRVKASPLARKVAGQAGVDLRLIQGSGPGGRIVRRDVEAAATAPRMAPPPVPPARPAASVPARAAFVVPPRPEAEYDDVALSPIRTAIAKRMPLAKAPIPHFYVTADVAMDRAWALRAELNALEGQPKVSVNDLIIKACALALLKNPGVNASFQGQGIRVHHRAHIGVAVALDEGLITPVLRDCDVKPLGQIAVESRDLAERARGGKLRVPEMTGATFSISNLGMFDVDEFSAIINPPEGAILAVGSVVEKPVVENGEVRIGRRVKLTLSCDHRVMDGAMGARFLQDVKRLLQEPLRLLA
ncbi:MAG TPA: dihydrolipoamide acetyltransferase family protein [Candidatus Methylomirabilis sp.]|nr:dihydrolipoamide acetyltransferase family protein [Candidatus Methylomirabilis sp.]